MQYESKGDKILTLKEYLNLIEKYLKELIEEYKLKGEWNVQLTIEVNFISLKPGSDENRIMYTRSDNAEIMFGDDNDDIIEQLSESLLQKYEENLQNKMRGSEFEFDGVNFLYYDFNKTSINRGGSYIDSPKWLKDKKSSINPKNNDDKYFQYAVTLALNFDKVKKDPQRISKIKPFIEKYNWEDIDFPSTSKDWKKIECNNEVALNILYVPYNTKKINIAYKSKNNLTQERKIILLIISDGQKWHYLVAKNLSGLLRGITSNHKEDFYCLNCFHSYSTKNKLEAHKKICENHDYCYIEMPTKNNNIIKYNHGEKSMKLPFVIYADLEYLLEKMSTCINDPNESSTTEINKHAPSGYSIFTHCSFDESKNKLNYYRKDDCMKNFSKDLREHVTKIINYEKKKMIPLTTEEKIYHNKQKTCYICKKEFNNNDKKNYKVRDHCHYTGKYRGAAHNICNIRYKVSKEIPIVFHNGSTYDYHFIVKEIAKEFDGNFECLGENTEKYITFSVPINKKIENKDLEITFKIKFIDSYRFMSSSLSKLVDNLPEGIHNNKCLDCNSCLDYIKIKNEKLLLKCFNCNNRKTIFGKTIENIRKYRDIKLVTADKKRSKLVSEPNYHTINLISEDLSIIEIKITKVKMNKPIYLGLPILEISKILMYEFWYDYMKPKYDNNVKLCYRDTDSFIMDIKRNDFYKDIENDVENRFDTSNYEVNRPLPMGKNKKVISLMKDELDGKIITEFVTLRPKTYSYLTDDGKEDKKAKGTKKMCNEKDD